MYCYNLLWRNFNPISISVPSSGDAPTKYAGSLGERDLRGLELDLLADVRLCYPVLLGEVPRVGGQVLAPRQQQHLV